MHLPLFKPAHIFERQMTSEIAFEKGALPQRKRLERNHVRTKRA